MIWRVLCRYARDLFERIPAVSNIRAENAILMEEYFQYTEAIEKALGQLPAHRVGAPAAAVDAIRDLKARSGWLPIKRIDLLPVKERDLLICHLAITTDSEVMNMICRQVHAFILERTGVHVTVLAVNPGQTVRHIPAAAVEADGYMHRSKLLCAEFHSEN